MYSNAPAPARPAIRGESYLITHVFGITLLLALLASAINYSGLDLAISRMFFDPASNAFPWRASRALELLGHRVVLVLPVGVAIAAMAAAIASHWFAPLRPWRGALWGIALTCALGQVIISQLKHYTALPRPYNLSMFGGYANYPDHFWAASRRQAGGALPSNHAGAGYAMLSLYFAGWAMGRPAWRWGGLAIGIAAGLSFAAVRVAQGAHFTSQTVWSACVMWAVASVLFYPLITRPRPGLPIAQQDARQP
ncbi:phosphatase PAP2 family protein [Bordetella genomosp. 11]|uniref:Acid phosphatase n=1 Tax=Bordetella genomosp. 11 TaxID=1416808 RepID=A0A261UYG7_9BORD|nr:phosphatase PAP2 family protein [Bordetella genomosp. 11]OZI66617.1 acid phosphatase [Bordetella genomosp. 11]